jgi:hypothetical protein
MPTREDAFEAFCTLLAFIGRSGAQDAVFDQRPGHLPPDAKSADAYKRWHRRARRAGVARTWVRGKLLLATAEAWTTPLVATRRGSSAAKTSTRPTESTRAAAPGSEDDDDAALDAALGIRRTRRAR